MSRIVYPVVAVALAALGVMVYAPSPPAKDDCEVYTVNTIPVTSFVMKPPECHPTVIHEKCETPRPEVSEPKIEHVDSTNMCETPSNDGHKRRRYRHMRRHRRYW